ncbi:MAG: ADP-ribosylglycohydrolase family protein [Akkermansiaceae bacterium]|nr:ADP-ribosylglycohydrolase family protein [Akkermansiaceae bacterium]
MSTLSPWTNAYQGSLTADALAMPVHWYYDTAALREEYGTVDHFMEPRHPHSGSILWRSEYQALNAKGDILRDQAQYWGMRGVHYHQFLKAGENTLNYRLARELFAFVNESGGYDPDAWLERYITRMLEPGWHRDTYVEEYHRAFFTRYSEGKKPRKCGISDEHIGGLATVPALCAALCSLKPETELSELRMIVKEHVGLTHAHANVLRAADTLVRLLWRVTEGMEIHEAIRLEAGDWISGNKSDSWLHQPDEHVIGSRFSPACYIADAMPAALYLVWKYHHDFSAGIIANAMVGGDNCHRGAVVGSILGAACGVPERFLTTPLPQGPVI